MRLEGSSTDWWRNGTCCRLYIAGKTEANQYSLLKLDLEEFMGCPGVLDNWAKKRDSSWSGRAAIQSFSPFFTTRPKDLPVHINI